MSDQGELAKRWNAQSDDTNAYSPVDDATGPMPAVEPVDEYGPAPAWADSAEPDRAESGWAGTGQAEAWPAGPQEAVSESAQPFEPAEERPLGRLVFPEAPAPDVEDEFTAGGAAPLPSRMPRPPRASEYPRSDYAPSDSAPSDYPTPDPVPEFGGPALGTPDDGWAEAPTAGSRTEFSAPPAGGWEGSLFDGTADSEPGDGRYAPVMPSGPGTPPKPGTPSSGNLRIPDWMREENGGGSGGLPGEDEFEDKRRRRRKDKDERRDEHKDKNEHKNEYTDEHKNEDEGSDGGSRLGLFAGVGLLVVALIASAGVYLLKSRDGSGSVPSEHTTGQGRPAAGTQTRNTLPTPPDKALRRFPGTPTAVAGRLTDARAGLSYPRFGSPWQMPTKQNKLGQLGWSGQQIVVTERRGGRLWYGQMLSGTLNPAELSMYGGKGTEQSAAVAFANSIETRFYGFPHRAQPFASQPLTVDGHKGWLISSYLRYQRPGVKATGELLVTAVIDTGRKAPAVLFMGIPNTHRKLWADVSYFLSNLHVVR